MTHILARRSTSSPAARTLRLPPWELIQIGLGLLIPFLLFPHIVNTRIAHVFFSVEDNYLYELARLWPASAILQSTLLRDGLGARLHRHPLLAARSTRPIAPPQPVLLFIAIAIPLAALGGFMVSGRAVAAARSRTRRCSPSVKELTHWPNAADGDTLARLSLCRAARLRRRAGLVVALCIAWRYYAASARPKSADHLHRRPDRAGCRTGRRCSRSAA